MCRLLSRLRIWKHWWTCLLMANFAEKILTRAYGEELCDFRLRWEPDSRTTVLHDLHWLRWKVPEVVCKEAEVWKASGYKCSYGTPGCTIHSPVQCSMPTALISYQMTPFLICQDVVHMTFRIQYNRPTKTDSNASTSKGSGSYELDWLELSYSPSRTSTH